LTEPKTGLLKFPLRTYLINAGSSIPGSEEIGEFFNIVQKGNFGKRIEEDASVGTGQDPGIEDCDETRVVLSPDKPSESLFQQENRLGQVIG
jgi:hypothetical protein